MRPKIEGVFGVEDLVHPLNRCGMVEVESTIAGTKRRHMVPLDKGYYPKNDPKARPDVSLIRLPPASADNRLLGHLLTQNLVIGYGFSMLIWTACCALPSSRPAQVLFAPIGVPFAKVVLVGTIVVHLIEGAYAWYLARAVLKLPADGALRWAVVVSFFGWSCLRWLLRLRKRAKID